MQENPLYHKQASFILEALFSKLSYYVQKHLDLM
jgi:hypothetical protein